MGTSPVERYNVDRNFKKITVDKNKAVGAIEKMVQFEVTPHLHTRPYQRKHPLSNQYLGLRKGSFCCDGQNQAKSCFSFDDFGPPHILLCYSSKIV